MPVVFAELASTYPPRAICDPACNAAAANGQYLMIRREVYEEIGGHSAVRDTLLEDVAIARAVKQRGLKIRFRYGADAVSTRMYRSFGALCEGWTKNLALLFPHAPRLAVVRALECIVIGVAAIAAVVAAASAKPGTTAVFAAILLIVYGNFLRRIARAHFGWVAGALALFGLPFFSYLLARSAIYYASGRTVPWRGREYRLTPVDQHSPVAASESRS